MRDDIPKSAGLTWNASFPSQRAVDDQRNRERARAKFKDEAKQAVSDYEVERAATLQKTASLRALRLARDEALAADAGEGAKSQGDTRAKAAKTPKKAPKRIRKAKSD